MRGRGIAIIACAFAFGCQDRPSGTDTVVEANDLSITHVEISHGKQGSDRLVTIRGLDVNDQEVAVSTLRTGMVLYSPEPDLMPAGWSAGTELTASMGEDSYDAISPDREPHEAAAPIQATLVSFFHLNAVAAAIREEAGISFAPVKSADDVAYSAGNCTPGYFPTNKGNPSQCCQDGTTEAWFKVASGADAGKLSARLYAPITSCTTSSGSQNCNGTGCYYGPCAAAALGASGSTDAKVFHPTSAPTQCGRDDDGTGPDAGTPESYSNQSLYGQVTSSCPYVNCCLGAAGTAFASTTTSCPASAACYNGQSFDGYSCWPADLQAWNCVCYTGTPTCTPDLPGGGYDSNGCYGGDACSCQ